MVFNAHVCIPLCHHSAFCHIWVSCPPVLVQIDSLICLPDFLSCEPPRVFTWSIAKRKNCHLFHNCCSFEMFYMSILHPAFPSLCIRLFQQEGTEGVCGRLHSLYLCAVVHGNRGHSCLLDGVLLREIFLTTVHGGHTHQEWSGNVQHISKNSTYRTG